MAELALCDQMGIPHSHFLGGPLRWTEDDQEKALAYHQFKGNVCRTCGTEPHEWDPAHGGHREAYIGGQSRCEGDVILAQEAENIAGLRDVAGSAAVAGMRPILIPRAHAFDDKGEPADG